MDERELPSGPLALIAAGPTADEEIGRAAARQLALRALGSGILATAIAGAITSGPSLKALRPAALVVLALALAAPSGLYAWALLRVPGPPEALAIAVAAGVLKGGLLYACAAPVVGLAAVQGAEIGALAALGAILVGAGTGFAALRARVADVTAGVALGVHLAVLLVLLAQLARVIP